MSEMNAQNDQLQIYKEKLSEIYQQNEVLLSENKKLREEKDELCSVAKTISDIVRVDIEEIGRSTMNFKELSNERGKVMQEIIDEQDEQHENDIRQIENLKKQIEEKDQTIQNVETQLTELQNRLRNQENESRAAKQKLEQEHEEEYEEMLCTSIPKVQMEEAAGFHEKNQPNKEKGKEAILQKPTAISKPTLLADGENYSLGFLSTDNGEPVWRADTSKVQKKIFFGDFGEDHFVLCWRRIGDIQWEELTIMLEGSGMKRVFMLNDISSILRFSCATAEGERYTFAVNIHTREINKMKEGMFNGGKRNQK